MPTIEDIERRLRALDAGSTSYERFDDGGPLTGPVAVLPASFNPPTDAHLALLALAPGTHTPASLLSTRNADKEVTGAPLHHRVGMLLAARGELPFAVLAVASPLIPGQASVLADGHPEARFDFIVGFDTLVRVFDERYYDDMAAVLDGFFAHHRLIAANRHPASSGDVAVFTGSPAARDYAAAIDIVDLPEEPARVSSTRVRTAVGEGVAPPDVPATVARYIREHGLYRD